MPRFFFHIADGEQFADEEGAILPDVRAAIQVAAAGARGNSRGRFEAGQRFAPERIEIQDESGHIVAVVTFREAVGLEGPSV